LFLGQDDNPPGSVGEPLEHVSRSLTGVVPAEAGRTCSARRSYLFRMLAAPDLTHRCPVPNQSAGWGIEPRFESGQHVYLQPTAPLPCSPGEVPVDLRRLEVDSQIFSLSPPL